LQNLEWFPRIDIEFFRPDGEVRSDRGENKTFFGGSAVREPENRAVAEEKQVPRRFDPSFCFELF